MINLGKDILVDKLELLCISVGYVAWGSQCGEVYMAAISEIESPYDPEIPLLSQAYTQNNGKEELDIDMPIFTTTLFTIAKRWTKFKYPSVNESINKMWTYTYVCMCICSKEYYSATKMKF